MLRVMLLIPGASYRAPDFMAAAARLDIEVVVGTDERHPLQDLQPARQVALDFLDPEAGAAQVESFAERYSLDAIIAVDDAGARLAAYASRRLELPHNPVAAVEATRNKHLLRLRLAAAGLPSPSFQLVPTDADPALVAEALEFPVVLKPLSLSGSRGVIRADDRDAFAEAFRRIKVLLGKPDITKECGRLAGHILVEGYLSGIEVALEGLLTGGRLEILALFDKPDPLVGPFFEETIYVTPSRLPTAEQRRIAETTERGAAALGLRDGPIHAELRINEDGAFPIDIAARSIGGLCSRTLSFGTGISLEEIILRHATGAESAPHEREKRAAGVMMVPIPRAGRLRAIDGRDAAAEVPLIESVNIAIRPGSTLIPLPEGDQYLGFIFAKGDSPGRVEAALRTAHALLRFEID